MKRLKERKKTAVKRLLLLVTPKVSNIIYIYQLLIFLNDFEDNNDDNMDDDNVDH